MFILVMHSLVKDHSMIYRFDIPVLRISIVVLHGPNVMGRLTVLNGLGANFRARSRRSDVSHNSSKKQPGRVAFEPLAATSTDDRKRVHA
jgi:alpha-D-ribose 1-methylphosphonate 5-triphosphate synthase subunit PhnL